MARQRTGAGGVVFKRCARCSRDVLAVQRGEVTPCGKAEILSVSKEGDVEGKCQCGQRVTWTRDRHRPRANIQSG